LPNNKYRATYLPQADSDLSGILNYFLNDLQNPIAADNFMDELDGKVTLLENQPFMGSLYKLNHKFDFEYRQIFVGNFTVFYVVINNLIEIHRIIYSKRNMKKLIYPKGHKTSV